jgi:hypothetical protein
MLQPIVVIAVLMMAGVARGQVLPTPVEEPEGCLQATAHTNGACKLTYPNGNTVTTDMDGRTWIGVKKLNLKFQVFSNGIGTVTGAFQTTIIERLPEGDIIQAPQSEMMQIKGDCSSKSYQIWGMSFTDPNGFFQDMSEPEDVARRVMPGTPIEIVFGLICKSTEASKPSEEVQKMMDQEETLNDKCRDGVTNPQGITDQNLTQKVCAIRDEMLEKIKTAGWSWGHEGQVGADRTWEPVAAK